MLIDLKELLDLLDFLDLQIGTQGALIFLESEGKALFTLLIKMAYLLLLYSGY